MAYTKKQWEEVLNRVANGEAINDVAAEMGLLEKFLLDNEMMRRNFDAFSLAHKHEIYQKSEFVHKILNLDPIYREWFEEYAQDRGYSNTEAEVHVRAVSEQLFSDSVFARGSSGEQSVAKELEGRGVRFSREHTCDGLVSVGKLRFDFFLLDYSAAIEFHGEQHYRPIPFFGGQDGFIGIQKRDKLKALWCEKNRIQLFVIAFDQPVSSSVKNIFNKLRIHRGCKTNR